MAENGKRITVDQFLAARDVSEKYMEQQKAERIAKADAVRAEIEALIADFGGNETLREWALNRHEIAKLRGIGTGMTQDQALSYYLRNLKVAVVDVCQAFGLDPRDLTRPA